MFMYVGHDSTVANLLEGLKVWDMQIPGYSIMTMVELHENELGYNVQVNFITINEKHYVELF